MSEEITIYNSTKELKLQKIDSLSQLAINRLTEFNKNPLGEKYELAIRELVKYILFYTNKEKIIAFPMSTGSGKSTITELSMAYMYNDDLFKNYCGTIILKLTRDDCNSTAININKYANKEIAYAYHGGDVENGKANDITIEDLQTYPILIMTHEGYKSFVDRKEIKTKSKRKKIDINDIYEWTDKRIDKLTVNYNIFTRQRLIIDEEISNVETVAINIKTINIIENAIMNMGNNDLYDVFMSFINSIKKEFIKSYTEKANKLNFVYFENIVKPEGMDEAIYDSKDYKARECYINILNLLEHGGYVRYSTELENKSITTFKYIDIYNPRFAKLQLDATADVNKLYIYNPHYEVKELPEFKTYKNTYLHIYDKVTGSRSSLIENFDLGMLQACIKDIGEKLLKGEKGLIVFNNKQLEYGFYEEIQGTDLVGRVWITHYGLTTGSNQWKDYDKVFVYGLNIMSDAIYPILYHCNSMEEDFNKYDTMLIPKKGSRAYAETKFEEVRVGLVSSAIIQAINRIKIRKYCDGDTPETHIYMLNSDKSVDNIIKGSMKGINILYDWQLDFTPPIKERKSKVEDNTLKIINYLKFLIENPESKFVCELKNENILTDKGIKKKDLREGLDFANRPAFNRALDKPIFTQFCIDYNIDMSNKNNKYIGMTIK